MMPGWKTPYEIDSGKGVIWRNNTGFAKYSYKGRDRMVKFGVSGMPDIMGFLGKGARIVGFEVKQPGQKPTDLQMWFGQIIWKAGGLWGWGTSYDDCDNWLKQAGL